MALDTIEIARQEIAKIYIAAFNRVPDSAGLDNWMNQYNAGLMSYEDIAADFANQAEYQAAYPAYMTDSEYITAIYNNVFGRTPDAEGLQNWINQIANPEISGITRGSVMREMLVAADAAGNTDGMRLDNQAEFAIYAVLNDLDINSATNQLSSITSDAASVDTAITNTDAAVTGETFMLTDGLDNILGTTGNDTIIGSVNTAGTTLQTMDAIDVIDGGAGIDTFKLSGAITLDSADLANISNVEVLQLDAAVDIGAIGAGNAFDTTGIDGLTTLNVIRGKDVFVESSDTTNINVSGVTGGTIQLDGGKNIAVTDGSSINDIAIGGTTAAVGTITVTDSKQGAGNIDIDGGTNVTVTSTSTVDTGTIIIGAATEATGAVSVSVNLNADGSTGVDGGDVTVTGGTAVTVNAQITVNAADATATGSTHTFGDVTVLGDSHTTTVTSTQAYAETEFTEAAVAVVKETATVTFKAMTSGETLEIETAGDNTGLTFTASKNLTAAEVAAAFASLTATDIQTGTGPTANGIFTGALPSGWTSATVSGATVLFTASDHNQSDLVFTGTAVTNNAGAHAPTQVKTTGTAAVAATTTANTFTYGAVDIQDNATAAITTVTLDGFSSASIGIAAGATTLDALTTLSLANNTTDGSVDLATAATTLDLTVNNITSTGTAAINLDNNGTGAANTTGDSVTDLTINATGAASRFTLVAGVLENLTVNASVGLNLSDAVFATTNLVTVDVNGAGAVNLGNITAADLNTFDASGNTGGVTATIETDATDLTGDIAEYVFSGGADVVTLQDNTVSVKVSTGAGNDKVTLAASTTSLAAVIDGGTDTDTLHMNAADAVTASAGTTFQDKITSFEKLSLGAASATGTVDLNNMDDISYVISANSTGGAVAEVQTFTVSTGTNAAVAEVQTIDFLTNSVTTTTGTILVGGVTVNLDVSDNAVSIAAKVAIAVNGQVITAPATTTTAVTATANNGVVTITYPATANFGSVTVADGTATLTGAPVVADNATAFDSNAGNITVNGGTVALTAGMTVDQVGAAIAAAQAAIKAADVTVDTVTYDAATDTVTITYLSASGNVGDGVIVNTSATGAIFSAYTTVTPGALTGGAAQLTLDNMANDGTLELTTVGAGVIVTMDDATGDADTFNIVVSDALTAAGINVGSVTVDGVETVDVTVADTFVDANENGLDDTDAAHTLDVDGDSVTTINVDGAGDVTLTTTSTVLETVNASTLTGSLTFVAALNDLVVTSGSAADTLTANADDVTLNAGNGANTFNVSAGADRAILTGGTGVDTFNINGASTTASTYANITAVTSGDVIKFAGATSFDAVQVTLSAGSTITSQALLNQAVANLSAGEMGWFNFGGNTYIVMDAGAETATFTDAQDMVVMITGSYNLGTQASYNATSNTLEIA